MNVGITEPGQGQVMLGRAGQDPSSWLGTEVTVKSSFSAGCWILGKHSDYCMEQDNLMDLALPLINQFTYSILTIQTLLSLDFKKW